MTMTIQRWRPSLVLVVFQGRQIEWQLDQIQDGGDETCFGKEGSPRYEEAGNKRAALN